MGSPYYAEPRHNNDDLNFFNESSYKVYKMSQGDIELTVYYGKGVEVYYAPVGVTHRWPWMYKELAWDWARQRQQHLSYVRAIELEA